MSEKNNPKKDFGHCGRLPTHHLAKAFTSRPKLLIHSVSNVNGWLNELESKFFKQNSDLLMINWVIYNRDYFLACITLVKSVIM